MKNPFKKPETSKCGCCKEPVKTLISAAPDLDICRNCLDKELKEVLGTKFPVSCVECAYTKRQIVYQSTLNMTNEMFVLLAIDNKHVAWNSKSILIVNNTRCEIENRHTFRNLPYKISETEMEIFSRKGN